MERSKDQSFLSCIADVYNYKLSSTKKRKKPLALTHATDMSIRDIKKIIIDHLNIDNFVTYQKSTHLYQALHENNSEYLLKIIIALNNFKAYLSDDTIDIDYEYLWDIICVPIKGDNDEYGGIFDNGLNLLILKSPAI